MPARISKLHSSKCSTLAKMKSLLRQAEQKLLRRKKKKRKFGKPPKPPRPPENLPTQKRGMKLHLKLGGADISKRSDSGPPPLCNEDQKSITIMPC